MQKQSYVVLSNADREWCEDNAVQITYPGRPDYPESLSGLYIRPGFLSYIGRPVWQETDMISVVGSRNPNQKSLIWLEEVLNPILKKRMITIVSGGARGVDQKAHRIALANNSPTVVFVPSGLRKIYPTVLQEWIQPIVDAGGCIVSPFLPSQPMYRGLFQERNKFIAAISPFTLVVECRRRSGTMLTAKFVQRYGRELGVMPTFPDDSGRGGLDLLFTDRAIPICDSVDLELILNRLTKFMYTKSEKDYICSPCADNRGNVL